MIYNENGEIVLSEGYSEHRIVKVIQSLPKLDYYGSVSIEQVEQAESALSLQFAEDYIHYLLKFGFIIAEGIELTGISKAKYRNVVSVTTDERKYNPQVPKDFYVIEETNMDGIVIWQDINENIYQTRPHKPPKKIANSLSDYLISRIK